MTGPRARWLSWARDPAVVRRIATLGQAPVFRGLSPRLLGRLAARCFERAYVPGEVVFREGEPGKGLYVILEGSVAVTRGGNGEHLLRTLGPGECFGELALIDDLPRSATARVTAPARLLILYRSHFEALVEGDRRIALAVMRNLLRLLASYVRVAHAELSQVPEPGPPPAAAAPDPTPAVPEPR